MRVTNEGAWRRVFLECMRLQVWGIDEEGRLYYKPKVGITLRFSDGQAGPSILEPEDHKQELHVTTLPSDMIHLTVK